MSALRAFDGTEDARPPVPDSEPALRDVREPAPVERHAPSAPRSSTPSALPTSAPTATSTPTADSAASGASNAATSAPSAVPNPPTRESAASNAPTNASAPTNETADGEPSPAAVQDGEVGESSTSAELERTEPSAEGPSNASPAPERFTPGDVWSSRSRDRDRSDALLAEALSLEGAPRHQRLFEAALAHPGNPHVAFHLAREAQTEGDLERAELWARHAIRLRRRRDEYRTLLVEIQRAAGD